MSGLLGWIQQMWNIPSTVDSSPSKPALDLASSQQYSHNSSQQQQQTSLESTASAASRFKEMPALSSISSPGAQQVAQTVSHPMQSVVQAYSAHLASPASKPRMQVSTTTTSSSSSSSSSSCFGCSWRHSIQQAATKLSCKTVLDPNTRLASAEFAWHVRLEQQQLQHPARLAVKLSNKHSTRVTFDAQVALSRSNTHMLRLAGAPQGIHSASLLIKPARLYSNSSSMAPADSQLADICSIQHSSTTPCSLTSSSACSSAASAAHGVTVHGNTSSSRQDFTAAPHETAPSIDSTWSHSTVGDSHSGSSAGWQHGIRIPECQSQQLVQLLDSRLGSVPVSLAVETTAGGGRAVGPPKPRQLRARRRPQQGRSARHTPNAYDPAQTGRKSSAPKADHHLGTASTSDFSAGPTAAPTNSTGLAAQLQWEVGWNWKVGGPVASVTKHLEPTVSSSGPSTLFVQQVKAAYDAKARSYTLTADGAGWNVVLAVPTQKAGISGLVPRVWCSGCRPKLTLNLVPELTCF